MSNYKKISLDITRKQLENAAKGKQITLSANQLKGSTHSMHVHPSSHEKIMKSVRAGKGCRMHIAPGEIHHDLAQGGSIWSWIKTKAFPWIKNELYPALKPAISQGLDLAEGALMRSAPEYAPGVMIGRKAIRSLTGLGLKPVKGSQAAKDHMAMLRTKRKGGSFRLS
jgi:hypothetical protein